MKTDRAYPRVLVVDANPFCRHMNIGILKSVLFEGWPKDSLAQIMYSNGQPGFDVCNRYWTLGKTSILLGALGLDGTYYVCSAFDPAAAVEAIEKHGITLVYATPTHFHALLAAFNGGVQLTQSFLALAFQVQ